jgi:hypothetical protein
MTSASWFATHLNDERLEASNRLATMPLLQLFRQDFERQGRRLTEPELWTLTRSWRHWTASTPPPDGLAASAAAR